MIDGERIGIYNSVSNGGGEVIKIAGPMAGMLLVRWIGVRGRCSSMRSRSFWSAVSEMLLTPISDTQRKPAQKKNIFRDIAEGFAYLIRERQLCFSSCSRRLSTSSLRASTSFARIRRDVRLLRHRVLQQGARYGGSGRTSRLAHQLTSWEPGKGKRAAYGAFLGAMAPRSRSSGSLRSQGARSSALFRSFSPARR